MPRKSYLLPTHAKPLEYEIQLTPDIHNRIIHGKVKILVHLLQETQHIVLHAHEFVIKSVHLVHVCSRNGCLSRHRNCKRMSKLNLFVH